MSDEKKKKPFKAFTDFPDGRTVVIETKEEWDALVNHFYQLRLMERKQARNILPGQVRPGVDKDDDKE